MEQFLFGRQAAKYFPELYGKKTFRQLLRYDDLVRRFKRKFKSHFCYLASAPGRVELIGNHTDHNGGRVLGCAVDLDIIAAFLPCSNAVHLEGNNYRNIDFSVDEIFDVESGSIGLAKGVLAGLKNRGFSVGGFKAMLNTELKGGAGMSSGAAFELLVAVIQNQLYNDGKIPIQTLAEVAQWSENVYFNKPCGLLDQGVIAVGGVVKMDFKTGFEYQKLSNKTLNMVVTDTGKSHSSLSAHYAAIPEEMKSVAAFFGKKNLSQVKEEDFYAHEKQVEQATSHRAVARAEHFFEENKRVDEAVSALETGDMRNFLRLLNLSGESSMEKLQNCSVDGDETVADAIRLAREICPEGAARVHGGGFQGTVLAVAKDTSKLVEEMSKRYGKENVKTVHARDVGVIVL